MNRCQIPQPRPSRRQQQNADSVRHSFLYNAWYYPRKCRDQILPLLNRENYTGFIDLCEATKVSPYLLGDCLDLLVKYGRLEQHELYYKSGDRLQHPGHAKGAYRGFEWGYRLTGKPPLKPVTLNFMPAPARLSPKAAVSCNLCGQTWPRDPRLEVPCPECRAPIGRRCHRPSGHQCEFHIPREQAAVDGGFLTRRCPGNPNSKFKIQNSDTWSQL